MNDVELIQSKVRLLPSRPPFMLDYDLAKLYGTTPKRINEAVKRNPRRFPGGFVFELSQEEANTIGLYVSAQPAEIRRGKNLKYLPKGFIQEGCNMMSTVLNTDIAVSRSLQITRTFTNIERGGSLTNQSIEKLIKKAVSKAMLAQPQVSINLPNDTALPMSLERKSERRRHYKGAKDPEVRSFLLECLPRGFTYEQATQAIKENWPDNPEKWLGKSSVARFWKSARQGKLKEFGIDPRMN